MIKRPKISFIWFHHLYDFLHIFHEMDLNKYENDIQSCTIYVTDKLFLDLKNKKQLNKSKSIIYPMSIFDPLLICRVTNEIHKEINHITWWQLIANINLTQDCAPNYITKLKFKVFSDWIMVASWNATLCQR